jgi:hypothetical protein
MTFAVSPTARLPLGPSQRTGLHNDAYSGFTHVADRAIASAPLRTQPLDHARGHRYQGPRHLPRPDSHRQAIVNLSLLRHVVLLFLMAPEQSRRTATLQQRLGDAPDCCRSIKPSASGLETRAQLQPNRMFASPKIAPQTEHERPGVQ